MIHPEVSLPGAFMVAVRESADESPPAASCERKRVGSAEASQCNQEY